MKGQKGAKSQQKKAVVALIGTRGRLLVGANRWVLRQISILALGGLLVSPVVYLTATGAANAQGASGKNRSASSGYARKRGPVRRQVRRVKRPQKSFLQGLFGGKPTRRRARARVLNPLFGSAKTTPRRRPSPSIPSAKLTKRMQAAALRDAKKARQRTQHRFGAGARGWGVDMRQGGRKARSNTRRVAASWGAGKYRTMCVRLCDGYYFPVSFKARWRDIKADEQRCNSGCYNAPTKLFYYSNPGGSIENMRTIDGERYKDITNAFKYRKQYVADCRCKADPWSEQAKQQHESWALVQADQSPPNTLSDQTKELANQTGDFAPEPQPGEGFIQRESGDRDPTKTSLLFSRPEIKAKF